MKPFSELLEDDLSSATSLHIGCLKLYGTDFYSWYPETVELELKKITLSISQLNLDKIQAISTLVTTDQFYNTWENFEKIGKVFNLQSPRFTIATPMTPIEIVWAITEADLNDEDHDQEMYLAEVKAYIESVFKEHDVCRYPKKILDIGIPQLTNKLITKQQILWEEDLQLTIKKRIDKIKDEIGTQHEFLSRI